MLGRPIPGRRGASSVLLSFASLTHGITIRFALSVKGLPFRTEWIEYPDIASFLKPRGVVPNPPPSAFPYTLPAIYDPHTGKTIMESYEIARYLDETYPDTPKLLPIETRAFELAFQNAFVETVHKFFMPIILLPICEMLNPASQKYFRETREAARGVKLEELSPPGSKQREEQFEKLKKGFSVLTSWFDAAGDSRLLLTGGGPDGDPAKVVHGDTYIAGVLIWARITWGAESEEWKAIESYDGGRWKRYLAFFEKWADANK